MDKMTCYEKCLYLIFGIKNYVIREETTKEPILEIIVLGNKLVNVKLGEKFVISKKAECNTEDLIIKDVNEKKNE